MSLTLESTAKSEFKPFVPFFATGRVVTSCGTETTHQPFEGAVMWSYEGELLWWATGLTVREDASSWVEILSVRPVEGGR